MLSPATLRTLERVSVVGVLAVAVAFLARTSFDIVSTVFLWLLLVPAVVGGGIALAVRYFGQAPMSSNRVDADAFSNDRPTDVINISRIRVAGIGGLGFVAMAAVIAIALQRVGETVILGLVGGVIAAVAVILYRRRHGPLTSSGQGPGGRAFLVGDDDDEEPTPAPRRREPEGARGPSGGRDSLRAHDEAPAPTRL
jgi:peptidoglycan/LPS O-acetylase OafA/YrhL